MDIGDMILIQMNIEEGDVFIMKDGNQDIVVQY